MKLLDKLWNTLNFIRSIIFMFTLYTSVALVVIVGVPVLISEKWTQKYLKVISTTMILVSRLFGIRNKIYNQSDLKDIPAIVCSNHISYYEIILLLHALPRPVFVMKANILKIPIYNWYCRRVGMIAINRNGPNMHWLDEAMAALAKGKQVVIFPEGTRVPKGRKISYKPGAFKLAKCANLPIIPATAKVSHVWKDPGFIKQSGTAAIYFHKPVDPDPELLRKQIESDCM